MSMFMVYLRYGYLYLEQYNITIDSVWNKVPTFNISVSIYEFVPGSSAEQFKEGSFSRGILKLSDIKSAAGSGGCRWPLLWHNLLIASYGD